MMEQINAVSKLLEQDPASIYQWVRQVQAGQESVPEGFNWLGLAEVATSRASLEPHLGEQQDLVWAHVALATYLYLINTNTSGNCDSLELSMMHLRVLFIKRYGLVPQDP